MKQKITKRELKKGTAKTNKKEDEKKKRTRRKNIDEAEDISK